MLLQMLIFMPCFKSIIFIKIGLKLSYFCQKNTKFSSVGGSAPRPPCLQRLGAFPPDPSLRRLKATLPHRKMPPPTGGPYTATSLQIFCHAPGQKYAKQICATSRRFKFCHYPTKIFWIRHWMLPQASLQNSLEFCETQKFSQRFVLLI